PIDSLQPHQGHLRRLRRPQEFVSFMGKTIPACVDSSPTWAHPSSSTSCYINPETHLSIKAFTQKKSKNRSTEMASASGGMFLNSMPSRLRLSRSTRPGVIEI